MPKISVIIATYNRSHLIEKTIDSILCQDFSDFEIIVVSDGSTDNTNEIVKSYNDKKISFIHQSRSGSPASPRNHGIRLDLTMVYRMLLHENCIMKIEW